MKIDILFYLDENITDEALVFAGEFIPDRVGRALKSSPRIAGVLYSIPASYAGRLKSAERRHTRKSNDDVEFWKDLFSKTGSDHIVKIFCDSPFIDPLVIGEMIDLHLEYLAEFTYSENLPDGLACEIVSRELIEAIPDMGEKTLPLSKVIRSNINQFDIELYYKSPDIRDKRITFRSSNARDKKTMENIHALGGYPEYASIKSLIESNPTVLFNGPSYLEIELTGRCELDCLFCYRKTLGREHGDMPVEVYKKILGDMRHFNLPYTVCLGGSGEPMMHPKFYEALESALTEPLAENIIVETNGIYSDANYANFIRKNSPQRIKTIVNINGMDGESYRGLHGADIFDRVSQNVIALKEAYSTGDSLFIQIMKINETEPFVDRYYDFWEKQKVQIIFQKQNTYLGKIEDRRYSDLSPIERTPCWHLQRDLYILSDGRAGFCKQDADGVFAAGDAGKESIAEIWNRRKESFIKDYNRKLSTAPDCSSCDEWYTFNF